MKVEFDGREYDFRPWRPADGRVLDGVAAFDVETTLIDDERPWLTPSYVLGASFDGDRGWFVAREHVTAFCRVHSKTELDLCSVRGASAVAWRTAL